uniref:NADH-ubiquinone oxidoreductase chain 6 n=1 Tax=Pantoxystus rubricollis TaxID=1738269 RepID=A0A343C1U1_9CUCU|nr:NADH dehydrogenase subunit 6 [Pantoxystus rubricollis]
MYMFILNWVFSIIFLFMNHPLSMGCILLIQTIIISLTSGLIYYNFWFSYILFLIMVSGMLIMFIYMTSIASNEMFKLPKKLLIFSSLMMILFSFILLYIDNYYSIPYNFNYNNMIQSTNLINYTLNKFFNTPFMKIIISLMIYLLITLIAIVKIVGNNSIGTLRHK